MAFLDGGDDDDDDGEQETVHERRREKKRARPAVPAAGRLSPCSVLGKKKNAASSFARGAYVFCSISASRCARATKLVLHACCDVCAN